MRTVLEGEILGPESESDRAGSMKRGLWAGLKGVARQIPFTEDALAAYFCATDAKVPLRVRGVFFGALACLLLPVGRIPTVLARVGFAGRLSAVTTAIATISAHITPAHRAAAKRALED